MSCPVPDSIGDEDGCGRTTRPPVSRPPDLAALGHELRAPLAIATGLANRLSERLAETSSDPEGATLARLLRLTIAQALAVADGLVVGAAPRRASDLAAIPFAPLALAEEIADLYGAALAPEGRRVTVIADPEIPAEIVGDPVRLRQVLINLVANAARAANAGDVVIRLDGADGRRVGFSVEDCGPGLPGGFKVARFRPGVAAHGAGLGLWISAGIVKAMGGRLTHADRSPHGTVMSFSIRRRPPATRGGKGGAKSAPRTASATGGDASTADMETLRILVIDDNEVARRLMETILVSFGMTPLLAADGAAAKALLAEAAPDAILLDWTLGTETGGEILDRLSKSGAPMPPVVVVSAAIPPPAEDRAAAILAKPFTPRELYATLALALGARDEAGGSAGTTS